jgi:GNAT acetyltransferase
LKRGYNPKDVVRRNNTMRIESEDQLMRIHVAALFGCDANGRLRYVREPWGKPYPPPRFYMGRTVRGNVWHFRHDLPDELVQKLEVLCRSEPTTADLKTPSSAAMSLKAVLQDHRPIAKEERGPAYLIPESVVIPSDSVLITKENASILKNGFPRMLRHVLAGSDIGPVAAVVIAGSPVSICYCARLTSSGAEAGVETREAMRRRGYATKAVAGWAAAIYERGLLPLYSTSWENLASLGVARALEMVFYGEDWLIE